MRKEMICLPALTKEVMNEVHGIIKPGQKLDYVHEGLNEAHIDQQMVRNILLNLISNAIKFSPENKIIKVYTLISEHEVKINVTDEGMGIPPEEHEHLFERFFRAKNATNIQGTGLGLNIVVKYLETMKGKIDFKSEIDKGTTFYITLPNDKP
jgi:signal transduction histidine kinase